MAAPARAHWIASQPLSALTLFGTITGLNPLSLGAGEIAAGDLGISPQHAVALQRIAAQQLGFTQNVPEPGTLALVGLGLWLARRRPGGAT